MARMTAPAACGHIWANFDPLKHENTILLSFEQLNSSVRFRVRASNSRFYTLAPGADIIPRSNLRSSERGYVELAFINRSNDPHANDSKGR